MVLYQILEKHRLTYEINKTCKNGTMEEIVEGMTPLYDLDLSNGTLECSFKIAASRRAAKKARGDQCRRRRSHDSHKRKDCRKYAAANSRMHGHRGSYAQRYTYNGWSKGSRNDGQRPSRASAAATTVARTASTENAARPPRWPPRGTPRGPPPRGPPPRLPRRPQRAPPQAQCAPP